MENTMTAAYEDVKHTAEEIEALKIPKIFRVLGYFRLTTVPTPQESYKVLDEGFAEAERLNLVPRFFRMLLHIGDVSRQHNLLKNMGILSEAGGSQQRAGFRRILGWMDKNHKDILYANLNIWAEFTVLSNLWYYELRTDRTEGTLISAENNMLKRKAAVYAYIKSIIVSHNHSLIARQLPKYTTGKLRKKKVVIKKLNKESTDPIMYTVPEKFGLAKVKLNGTLVTEQTFEVKEGDVVTMPRKITEAALLRRSIVNGWIQGLCKYMGWSIDDYKKFRQNQKTMEQAFSSKAILGYSALELDTFFDQLTSGQRSKMYNMLVYKSPETEKLAAKEGQWKSVAEAYILWESKSEKIAQDLRDAFVAGDKAAQTRLKKSFKVKSVGVKSIDLLKEVLDGKKAANVINNSYQAFVEKTPLDVAVFPVLDGSGSMGSRINGISLFDIACTMGIFFSTRNPVPEFRDTYGWFSSNFAIRGVSRYANTAPNRYMRNDDKYIKNSAYKVLDASKPFTENVQSIRQDNPGSISSTNMGSTIEYFVKLVVEGKSNAEDLPQVILMISDGEYNQGKSPSQAVKYAQETIGWNPLLILWQIRETGWGTSTDRQKKDMKDAGGLYITGFDEGVLNQIFEGINHGSINPYTEFFSLTDHKRYSVLKF